MILRPSSKICTAPQRELQNGSRILISFYVRSIAKGQIISKGHFGIFDSSKNERTNSLLSLKRGFATPNALSKKSEFVRTPKFNIITIKDEWKKKYEKAQKDIIKLKKN